MSDLIAAGEAAGHPAWAVRPWIKRWEEEGILITRDAWPSRVVILFDKARRDPATATLASAVSAYLADASVSEDAKAATRTALRTVAAAPGYCPVDLLLLRCETIPAAILPALPGRAQQLLAADAKAPYTQRNQRLALSGLVRYAADHALVPLVFPAHADLWAAAGVRLFPDEKVGGTQRRMVYTRRTGWRHFAAISRELFGDKAADPAFVTAEMAEEALTALHRRGAFDQAGAVRRALNYLGRRGEGPFRGEALGTLGTHPRKRREDSSINLKDPDGCPSSTWDDFVRLVAKLGFSQEWVLFLKWYRIYVSADWPELDRHPSWFPDRVGRRKLDETTLLGRIEVLKLWLGVAVKRCGLEPRSLRLADAFGYRFRQILASLMSYWKQRAEAGIVSASFSNTVFSTVAAVGTIADVLAAVSEHRRWVAAGLTFRVPKADLHGGDVRAERFWASLADPALQPSLDEMVLREAYALSRRRAEDLVRQQLEAGTGRSRNTVKRLRRVVHNLPPEALEAVQAAKLQELQRRLRAKEESKRFYDLAADCFLHGLVLSAAPRCAELTHVRLGVHYPPEERAFRRLALRPVDRKNKTEHWLYLHERYVPTWLEALYLDCVLPYLTREQHERRGRSPVAAHDWLIVDRRGRPYGCLEETAAGKNRQKRAWRRRARFLVTRWQKFVGKALHELGYEVPVEFGEFSIHAARNTLGNAVAQFLGADAAATHLGEQVRSALRNYIQPDAQRVLGEDPYGTGTPTGRAAAPVPAPVDYSDPLAPGGYQDLLRLLTMAHADGEITREDYWTAQQALAVAFQKQLPATPPRLLAGGPTGRSTTRSRSTPPITPRSAMAGARGHPASAAVGSPKLRVHRNADR